MERKGRVEPEEMPRGLLAGIAWGEEIDKGGRGVVERVSWVRVAGRWYTKR